MPCSSYPRTKIPCLVKATVVVGLSQPETAAHFCVKDYPNGEEGNYIPNYTISCIVNVLVDDIEEEDIYNITMCLGFVNMLSEWVYFEFVFFLCVYFLCAIKNKEKKYFVFISRLQG